MIPQNKIVLISFSTAGYSAVVGTIIVLAINAILALITLFAIFKKVRRRHIIFYLNILMLTSVITLSSISIPMEWESFASTTQQSLLIAEICCLSITKLIAEIILIVRLYTLYPETYSLLAGCIFLVLLRVVSETYGMVAFFLYDYHRIFTLLFVVEPFLEAGNNMVFSSAFILTLATRMCNVRHSIRGFRHHRLFLLLVLAIENMIIPCLTSIILAVYSIYCVTNTMLSYRYLISTVHIGATAISIVMTTLLGSTSIFKHYSLEELDEAPAGRKNRQSRSMSPDVKGLTRAENDEPEEFEFSYLGKGGSDC